MVETFFDKVRARQSGICLYGIAPPKQATQPERLAKIVARQLKRLQALRIDGLVVYDIQDEAERVSEPRPFPFLPTLDPERYAHDYLAPLKVPKIVYRSVGGDGAEGFRQWLDTLNRRADQRATVLVGTPKSGTPVKLSLRQAYALKRAHAPQLLLGGIAIAERHTRRFDEHERIFRKMDAGCRFFVTQAVYDATATKSLLSDLALEAPRQGRATPPILLTFSPCASVKTLAFMKWLGISFPRWLDNELRYAPDPLATSLKLCIDIFDDVCSFAQDKGIPIGINVESVSIRKTEIEASVELLSALRRRLGRDVPA